METNQNPTKINYNIFYECHYKDYQTKKYLIETEEYQNFSKEDHYFLEQKIYQDDLLYIFGMEDESEFVDDKINPIIHDLFLRLEQNLEMKQIMNKLGENDPEMGLMILFSMDLLYLSHPCICEFLYIGKISNEKLYLLNEELKKLFPFY